MLEVSWNSMTTTTGYMRMVHICSHSRDLLYSWHCHKPIFWLKWHGLSCHDCKRECVHDFMPFRLSDACTIVLVKNESVSGKPLANILSYRRKGQAVRVERVGVRRLTI